MPRTIALYPREQRHRDAKRNNARAFLGNINASIGQDFHTLAASQVDAVLAEARRVRYQRPKHANGSLARYFYDRMQRQAR